MLQVLTWTYYIGCDVDIQAQLHKTHDEKAQVHKIKNEVQDPIQDLGRPMTRERLTKIQDVYLNIC